MPGARERRWLVVARVAVVAVAVLVLGAVVGRYVWRPSHRPALEAGERYGVDVSNHQGAFDRERVAGDDMAFAHIEATEGGDPAVAWMPPGEST